jgi:hypothetical protein
VYHLSTSAEPGLTPEVELRAPDPTGAVLLTCKYLMLARYRMRTFRQWDRASLSAVRIAFDRRRKELTG